MNHMPAMRAEYEKYKPGGIKYKSIYYPGEGKPVLLAYEFQPVHDPVKIQKPVLYSQLLGGRRRVAPSPEPTPTPSPEPARITESRKSYLEYEKKQQEQALEAWRSEIRGQYPSAFYEVSFTDQGTAHIYERRPSAYRPIAMPLGIQMLERGAREEWLRREKEKRKGKWKQPLYKGVSKRPGSLAEYDVPYSIEEVAREVLGWREERLTPKELLAEGKLFGAHMASRRQEVIELRERIDLPKGKPATTPLELRQREYQLRQFIGPQLISLRMAKVKRLSEELYARGDPFGYFASGVISAGETTMELVFPHPTGVSPEYHDIFALPGQPPEFIVGRVVGEVATAVTLGKIFEGPLTVGGEALRKVGSKVVPKAVKTWVKFGSVAKTATAIKSKLPAIKGSRLDVWLTKHSKWYYKHTGGIAVQEVVQPAGVRVFDTATGKVVERVGTGYLTSSQIAWALAGTKRTSGISISKTFVEPLKPSMKHLFYRGGKLTVGYLSELGFKKTAIETVAEQRALTPIVTQTQVTRMGIIPTIGKLSAPTTVAKSTLKYTAVAFGISLGAKLRLKPKLEPLEWQPTLARERVKFRTVTLEKLEQKQKQLLAVPKLQLARLQHAPTRELFKPKLRKRQALKLPSLTLPRVVAKQEQKLMVTPKLVQTPKFVFPPKLLPPQPTLAPPIRPFRTPFGGEDVSRGRKDLLGRWFKRTHPIKSHQEMWATFSGKPKRKGKRRKGVSWF